MGDVDSVHEESQRLLQWHHPRELPSLSPGNLPSLLLTYGLRQVGIDILAALSRGRYKVTQVQPTSSWLFTGLEPGQCAPCASACELLTLESCASRPFRKSLPEC